MSAVLCISYFELQFKHLEKFNSNRAKKNRRYKSKFFCMYGTVALWSPVATFYDRGATDLQLIVVEHKFEIEINFLDIYLPLASCIRKNPN